MYHTAHGGYYGHYSDILDDGLPSIFKVSEYEMFLFLSIAIQMEHCTNGQQ
jgi:hypothetical protein